MTHIALDLALGRSGVCWSPGLYDTLTCPKELHAGDQLHWWHSALRVVFHTNEPNHAVCVEAPFIHDKHPRGAIPTIKLHGVAEELATSIGLEWLEIAPASLKLWAAGSGRATKTEMCQAARTRGWIGTDHNEADAYLIWQYFAKELVRA